MEEEKGEETVAMKKKKRETRRVFECALDAPVKHVVSYLIARARSLSGE